MKKEDIIPFDTFANLVAIVQNVDNPKDTKIIMKDLYGRYAQGTPEERAAYNELLQSKVKPEFIAMQNFIESDFKGE